MPRNSSGVYTLPAGNPVVTGTTITTAWANPTMSDLAGEITNSLDRAGRGSMTGQLKSIDGVVTAPGITFGAELSSGWYRATAGTIRLAILASQIAQYDTSGLTLSGRLFNSLGTVAAPSYSFNGDANNGWWSPAADVQAWSVSGTEQMRLQSVGLGIGMTPVYRVDATGGNGNGFRYTGPAVQTLLGELDSTGYVGTLSNHSLRLFTNNAARVTVAAAGNVTVGAPSSGYPFTSEANGTLAALFRNTNAGNVNAGIAFGSPGSSNLSAGIAGLAASATTGSLLLQYVTGGGLTEGARLDPSGNFGIGAAASAGIRLDVNGVARAAEVLLTNGASSGTLGTTPGLYSPASGVLAISVNGAERLRINSTGDVGVGGTAAATYGSPSLWNFGAFVAASAQFNVHSTVGASYEFVHRAASRGFDFYVNAGATLAERLTSAGQAQFPAIHNNASGASGTTPMIASGTGSLTAAAVTNCSGVAGVVAIWTRVGNIVTLSGSVTLTITSSSSATEVDVTPVIPSNFTVSTDARGSSSLLVSITAVSSGGGVVSEPVGDKIRLTSTSPAGSAGLVGTFFFTAQYEVK